MTFNADPVRLGSVQGEPPRGTRADAQMQPPVHFDITANQPQGTSIAERMETPIHFKKIKAKRSKGIKLKKYAQEPVQLGSVKEEPPRGILQYRKSDPIHLDGPKPNPPGAVPAETSATPDSSIPVGAVPDDRLLGNATFAADKLQKRENARQLAFGLANFLRERYTLKAFSDQECLGVYGESSGCFVFHRFKAFQKFALGALEGTPYKCRLTRSVLRDIFSFLVFEPELQASPEDLNRHEKLINVQNGVVNLDDMSLLPHAAEYMFSSVMNVNFRKNCKPTPLFTEMIRSMFRNEPDMRLCLQSMAYLLSNCTAAKKIVYFLGVHDSGKSTLARLLRHIIGREFVAGLPIERFGGKFELGSLMSHRLNICPEVEKFSPRVVSVIKAVTGGDLQTLENKFEDISFGTLNIKFLMTGNVLPEIPPRLKIDDGFSSRILPVYFPHSLPSSRRIENYDRTLFEKEGDKIFRFLLSLLKNWYKRGRHFVNCDSSDDILDELRGYGTATERKFVKQELVAEGNSFLGNDELYAPYVAFCKERNCAPQSLEKLKAVVLRVYPSAKKVRKRLEKDGNPIAGIKGIRYLDDKHAAGN